MKNKKILLPILGLSLAMTLSACSGAEEHPHDGTEGENHHHQSTEEGNHNYHPTKGVDPHDGMVLEGSGEVPEGLKVAENPKFPVGSKALSVADHMGGMMDNVEVTIVGAFETTAYGTTYTSTTNGMLVEDHKWIIHEEFVDVEEEKLEVGSKVSTTAEHMQGMKDAIHTIDFSETTTVYMINFVMHDGQKVTNHKWVTEAELQPLKEEITSDNKTETNDVSVSNEEENQNTAVSLVKDYLRERNELVEDENHLVGFEEVVNDYYIVRYSTLVSGHSSTNGRYAVDIESKQVKDAMEVLNNN